MSMSRVRHVQIPVAVVAVTPARARYDAAVVGCSVCDSARNGRMRHVARILVDVERLTGRMQRATHSASANSPHGYDVNAVILDIADHALQFRVRRKRNARGDAA